MSLFRAALCAVAILTLAGCASRNTYSWIYDAEKDYVLSGFSVKPPSGRDWALLPFNEKAPNSITFIKPDVKPFANRQSEPNFELTLASAVGAILDEPVQSRPSGEFEKNVTGYIARYGIFPNITVQEMTRSTSLGPDCVTFKTVPKKAKVDTSLGEVEPAQGRGYFCLHPRHDNFGVFMIAVSGARTGISHTAHDDQVRHFFASLSFQPLSSVQRTFPTAGYRVGKGPTQIVSDGKTLWAALKDENRVVQLDPANGRILRSIEVGSEPVSLAGGPFIWVANRADGTVTKIDAAKGKVVATILTGGKPASISVGREGVWVADSAGNSVVRIDGKKEKVVATIAVGKEPVSVNVSKDGVWTANAGDGTVSLIDPAYNWAINTIQVGGRPARVSLLNDSAWIADEASTQVVRIERKTRTVTGRVEVGGRPGWIFSDHDVYVALPDAGKVVRIDPAADRVFGPAIDLGYAPTGLATFRGTLWAGNGAGDTVSSIAMDQFGQSPGNLKAGQK